jgi:hypothetical protein
MVIKAVRELGDLAGQIGNSKRDEQEARTAVDRALKTLRPAMANAGVVESTPVPPLASVEAHRDACRRLEQRQQACHERIRHAEQERARHRKAHERIIADEHLVAADELERLRGRREQGDAVLKRPPSRGGLIVAPTTLTLELYRLCRNSRPAPRCCPNPVQRAWRPRSSRHAFAHGRSSSNSCPAFVGQKPCRKIVERKQSALR